MPNILVIAADNTRARIFLSASSQDPLKEKKVLVHPNTRLQKKDLTSDRQGYSFSSVGHGRKAFSKHVDPKEYEIKQFVKEINKYLKILESNNDFDQLIIIAAPKLLGTLKKELDSNIKKLITYELNKNITKLSAAEIRTYLPKYLVKSYL